MLVSKINSLFNHKGFKKYFINSSWLIGEKIFRLIAGLVVGVYVARYLGPDNFGILNYALSFVALFAVIAPLGLDEIVINKLLISPDKKNLILGTAFMLKIVGAIITILLVSSSFLFHFNTFQTNIYIFIIVISYIFQSFYVIDFYFQSQVQAKMLVKVNIISLSITSVIRLILVFIKAPLLYFVVVYLLDSFFIAIGLIYFYKKANFNIFKWKYNLLLAKELLSKSWPLIFSSIVIMIYMRIDQIMLKQMIGFKSVGIYSAALRISELWWFIPMAIGGSLFPAIVNAKSINNKLFLDRFQALLSIMVVISLTLAIIITFFSKQIILLLYGQDYIKSATVLTIHIWTGIFVFIGVVSGKYLVVENITYISFYRSFSGAVANIFLNLILIPKFGIIGAAISTLVAQIIATYLFDFFNSKTRDLFYMKTKALFLIGIRSNLKIFNHEI